MNEYLSLLTVSQFRAFRRALQILIRAGIRRDLAVGILVKAQMETQRDRDRDRLAS
jgi:hypothetical protein